MNRFLGTILLFLVLCAGVSQAEVTVIDESFYSVCLEETKDVRIYLPPNYDPLLEGGYPVVYFLHGAFGSAFSGFPDVTGVLNLLYDDPEGPRIAPAIYVRPDGNAGDLGGSMWVNSDLGAYEDYVVYDVPGYIEATYNAASDAGHRAITGYSMGGGGSMHAALKHPDYYCAIAAHSGPLDTDKWREIYLPLVLDESRIGRSPKKPYHFKPTNGSFSQLSFLMAGAYASNPDNRPYPLDFPIDANGDLIQEVFDRYFEFDPLTIACDNKAAIIDGGLEIYFDCGTEDGLLLYPWNTGFEAALIQEGIENTFVSYAGNHYSQIHEQMAVSFVFIDDAFGASVQSADAAHVLDLETGPSPFNPVTAFRFELDEECRVDLEVFDIRGRRVDSVFRGVLEPGRHDFRWNAERLPSGVYFGKLTAGGNAAVRKVILTK